MFERGSCHECIHCESIIGDVHKKCSHPAVNAKHGNALLVLAALIRGDSMISQEAREELNIKLHERGVKMGWAWWPLNFDPVWVLNCEGFQASEAE